MNKGDKILITGSGGLVGSAIERRLKALGFSYLLCPRRAELDLMDPVAVKWYFSVHEPNFVFHCAARVGGLQDNIDHPVEFLTENLTMQGNVISNAAEYKVKKLLFLGSSCIYPTDCRRPMSEGDLLTGPFETAVEAYGLAKIMGIKLCQAYRQERGCNFISALPCNLFGVNDTLDARYSHIVPGLLLRMRQAKRSKGPFMVWGDGTASRELLFSDDLAEALHLIMDVYNDTEPINAGSGLEKSVREIAEACAATIDFRNKLQFDLTAPTGTAHKCLDNSKLFSLGWSPRTPFLDALRLTYADINRRIINEGARRRRKENPEAGKAIQRRYRERHSDRIKEAFKKRYHENREQELGRHRLIKYGLQPQEFESLLKGQENNCKICGGAMNPPNVDHCHKTKRVRGLLCGSCNRALGLLKDSPKILESALKYLQSA